MSGNHHIPVFDASDIDRYLKGEMSAPDMHALERAALDDPFLADAIEGFALHQHKPDASSIPAEMDELQSRLRQKTAPARKPVVFYIWRAAAAIIILIGAGLVTRNILSGNKPESLEIASARHFANAGSKTDSAPPPIAQSDWMARVDSARKADRQKVIGNALVTPSASDTFRTYYYNSSDAIASAPPTSYYSTPLRIAPGKKLKVEYSYTPTADYRAIAQPGEATGQLMDSVPDGKEVALDKEVVKSLPPSNASLDSQLQGRLAGVELKRQREMFKKPALTIDSPVYYNLYKNQALANKTRNLGFSQTNNYIAANNGYLSGRVLDFNNNALAGASVFLKNGNNANLNLTARTDRNGYFSLPLARADSADKLYVRSVGYDDATFEISNDSQNGNIIQLKPQSASLNQVVVTGYGSKRKETLERDIDHETKPLSLIALPTEGWDAYNLYIKQNKKTTNLDSTLIGKEVISFNVSESGKLSSFKVEQSISPAHDAEAIRLVKQGPGWKLIKGRKSRAVVVVPFP